MKSREETIKFAETQLDYTDTKLPVPLEMREGKVCHHYGAVELSDLIDFIYGEQNETE